MIEFKLPSLGADMDEGKLLQWKVKPGDRVGREELKPETHPGRGWARLDPVR